MRVPVFLLLVLLLAPAAQAHVSNLPPDIQGIQYQHDVFIEKRGTAARIDLILKPDPFSHLLRYDVDPAHGGIGEQYRPSAASFEGGFKVVINFTRVIEYRDTNNDLIYNAAIDTPVRTWLWSDATWTANEPRSASVNGVAAQSMAWDGKLPTGPRISLVVAASGRVFSDEGAQGAPQDMFVYLHLTEFPARGTGDLFSIEGTVTVDSTTGVREAIVAKDNLTTGLFIEAPERLAFLSWGGEAIIDGLERRVEASLGRRADNPDGTATYAFGLHMPILDKSARFVLVTGMQYKTPERGTPGFEVLLVVVAGVLAARWTLNRSSR